MRRAVQVASHLAQLTRVGRLVGTMKLPISLLFLVALGQAASPQSTAKSSEIKSPSPKSAAKSSETKILVSKQKKDNSQTSKRELLEGNFGDRKQVLLTKYGTSEAPGIQYAEDLKDRLLDQSPAHQVFGARVPQIAKISDVLTGQGPSFEAAVANHLYAPVSVYQARLSSPTSFEVPAAAESQLAYPNPKAYQPRKPIKDDKKLQQLPIKETELPRVNFNNVPVFAVQPQFRIDSFRPGFSHPQSSFSQEFQQPRPFARMPISQLFPVIYDQNGPIRYQEDLLPTQYLHQQGVYQLLPVDLNYQRQNHGGKDISSEGNRQELKAEPTQRPKEQASPASKQGYHAHPNGAISFATFSHSLPFNTQLNYNAASQSQTVKPHIQQQREELPPIHQVLPLQQQLQKQKESPLKQKVQYTPISHKFIQQVPKYQPDAQFVTVQQPVQSQLRALLNPFQLQQLVSQVPRYLPHSQTIQFQRLPAFKPLPPSLLTAESFFQPINTKSPYNTVKSHGYADLSTQKPKHIEQQVTTENFTPLPPLKANYDQYVKPLDPQTRTSPVFLPTPLQPLPSSTPKLQLIPDQLISSTTIQPDIQNPKEHKEKVASTKIQLQSQNNQPLEPEIIHQSQPTDLPLLIQSSTLQPLVTYDSQSEKLQHSTPRPEYQSTKNPQSSQQSPRHAVIIQQQELQELFSGHSSQPSSTTNYELHQQQNQHQQEQETHQLQSQQHLAELDQLRTQEFQHGLQDLFDKQYLQGARQLQYLQQQPVHHLESEQYHNQQNSESQQLQSQLTAQKKQQDTKHPLQSEPNIQSTANPTLQTEKQLKHLQLHPQSHPPNEHQSQFEATSLRPNVPEENPNLDSGRFLGPILSPYQPIFSNIYAQPQRLVTRQDFNPHFGTQTIPNVQYFGKFAQSLFGH